VKIEISRHHSKNRRDALDMKILGQLKNMKETLRGKHLIIAQYIVQNPEKVGYLTATALSKVLGISSSTLVRFVQQLGFKGFKEFKHQFLKELGITTPYDLILNYVRPLSNEKFEWIKEIFEKEIENIKQTLTILDMKSFNRVVELIENAPRVIITAASIAKALADRLTLILRCIKIPAYSVEASELYLFRQTLIGSKSDLYIVIGLEDIPRDVIRIVNSLTQQGSKVVAIVDDKNLKLAQSANYTLSIASERIGGFYSVAPFNTLFTAVVIGLAVRIKSKTPKFKDMEEIYKVWERLL